MLKTKNYGNEGLECDSERGEIMDGFKYWIETSRRTKVIIQKPGIYYVSENLMLM